MTSTPTPSLPLLCQNGNYLASLTVVREEFQQRLPVYHRRVPLPINRLDTTGSYLPEKSVFYNRNGQVMVKELDSGVPTWQAHELHAPSPDVHGGSNKKHRALQRCTFGLPRISPFATPSPTGTSREECSCRRDRCACNDAYYEGVIGSHFMGSRPIKGGAAASPVGSQVASSVGRGSPLRPKPHVPQKFLAPLTHVKSYNLFQKILRQPGGETMQTGTRGTMSSGLDTFNNSVAVTAAEEQQPQDDVSFSPDSTMGSVTAAAHQRIRNRFAAPSRGGGSEPLTSKHIALAQREDLNSRLRVAVELAAFDKREAERREREEFARAHEGSFAASVLTSAAGVTGIS